QSGCDFNSYRLGARSFYGPGADTKEVDTRQKFTVVTHDDLLSRFYMQNGTVVANSVVVNVPGMSLSRSIDDSFCSAQSKAFSEPEASPSNGGMESIGNALGRGMVLVFSIWMDAGSGMLWLDGEWPLGADGSRAGVSRGPCEARLGDIEMLREKFPDARVTWRDVGIGEVGSTVEALRGFES
ncbi:glycoside hydrolase family 7 protein, partial [Cadophora sp. DSE1049]